MSASGSRVMEVGAVDEVDAEDPERLLLAHGTAVEEVRVDQHLGRRRARPRLEPHAEPATAAARMPVAARGHRVGEGKERGPLAPRGAQRAR